MFNDEELFSRMRKEVITVTFKKKTTGEIRVMDCTLVEKYLPKTSEVKQWPDRLIVVFDIENECWRSFYKDTVIKLEDSEGEVLWEVDNG